MFTGLFVSAEEILGLESALGFSSELLGQIRGAWSVGGLGDERRSTVVAGLSQMSVDHATAVQSLICTLLQSAISLVRPQYEALVRSIWACHVAPESDLERLLAPLTLESQQAAKKLPGVQGMFVRLQRYGPQGAGQLLARARENLYVGLNSYLHAGIHPLARQLTRYPEPLLVGVLMNSNALAMLTILNLAQLRPEHPVLPWMTYLHRQFENVPPPLEPLPAAKA